MKLFSHIRFDLTIGLWRRGMWVKYLLWSGLFTLASWEFSGKTTSLEISQCTYGDYLLYIFGGMREYIPAPGEPFQIPFLWLINHIGILYFTLHYMHDDLEGFGQQMILRSGSRPGWWHSKCIWNVVAVLAFYLIAWGTIFLWASFQGALWSMKISPFMPDLMVAGPRQIFEFTWEVALEITLLPLLVTMSMSLVQMLLCLVIRPTFSYILSVIVMISSAYYLSPALLGNYAMALRSDKVVTNGVPLTLGIVYSLVLIVLSVVLGSFIFHKTNILSKEE